MGKLRKRKLKKSVFVILILFILCISGVVSFKYFINKMDLIKKTSVMYLASDSNMGVIYGINDDKSINLDNKTDVIRGSSINVFVNRTFEDYFVCLYKDVEYYCNKNYLVDSLDKVVLEKELYVRTSYNLNKDSVSTKLLGLVKKGDKVNIIGFDKLLDDGSVNMYKVNVNDMEGYFYNKYLVKSKEESLLNYDEDNSYKIHKGRTRDYGGGTAATLDYYPVSKPKFSDNVMPSKVYSLFLAGTNSIFDNIDNYISLAKETNINAFVVDIIGDNGPAYKSSVYDDVCPSCNKKAQISVDKYKSVINKLRDNGFYVIGRITAFKNYFLANDNKDFAIKDGNGNKLYWGSSYWPTAFNRDVWEFNVNLAIDAVKEFGFNEIQFDYCRFPDSLGSREKNGTVNYSNTYKETKAEAIQRFLMYASNEIHRVGAYLSVDVFGESSWGYVTAYGQYYGAMSNVVDVISAMPYTDHFDRVNGYAGYKESWKYPYEVMKAWGKTAKARRDEVSTPAVDRTWITAYNTPYWGSNTIADGDYISKQVEGLYDAGLTGGFMTWNSTSSLDRFKSQKSGFSKEYGN